MAKYWRDAGHEVTIISTTAYINKSRLNTDAKRGSTSLDLEGIHLHVLDIPYSHFMPYKERLQAFYAFYKQAYRLGEKIKGIEVLVAYSAPLSTGFLGRKLAKKLSCPFVFEVADVWPDVPIGMGIIRHPLLKRWLHAQTRRLYRSAAAICTFTEDMKEQIVSHDIASYKVHVIHNGVKLSAFVESPPADKELVKVVYTGSLGQANGLSQLLYAWKLIEKKWSKKISCHIVGEGNEGEMLRDLAKELELKSLFFHEPVAQQEIGAFLEGADIGLVCIAPFAVLQANGSSKAFEYMAAGIPCVLNYEGWLAQYLADYTCGLSSPLGQVERFAQQINQLILNKELRREMGQNARRLAAQKFDRKILADKMLTLFEEVTSFT